MQVGFMMQKSLGELFILKSTKPLPIISKSNSLITVTPLHTSGIAIVVQYTRAPTTWAAIFYTSENTNYETAKNPEIMIYIRCTLHII